MWLLLNLKYELLLGVYSNRRTVEAALNALKKLDKKKAQELAIHYIDVDEFHEFIAPMFLQIRGDIDD